MFSCSKLCSHTLGIISATLFLFFICLQASYSYESTYVFSPLKSKAALSLLPYIEYLKDTNKKLTILDVSKRDLDSFSPLHQSTNFGYTDDVYWVKFTLDLSQYKDNSWFLIKEFYRGEINLYYPTASGFSLLQVDDTKPLKDRKILTRDYIFKVPAPESNPATYYMRIDPRGNVVDLDFSWSGIEGTLENMHKRDVWVGLFFGCLLVMLFYNAILYLYVRDPVYLYYIYYLSFCIGFFFDASGTLTSILDLSPFWIRLSPIFTYAALHGAILFTQNFLSLKVALPLVHKYLKVIQIVLFLCTVGALFFPIGLSFHLTGYTALAVFPVLLVSGIYRCYQGYAPAWFYCSGWLVLGVTSVMYVLFTQGLLPVNSITSYGVYVGAVWEAVMFSLALGYRIKLLDQEKKDALEMERSQLEQRVTERTETLQSLLESRRMVLANASHELRTPVNALRLLLDTASCDRASSGTIVSNVSVIASHMSQLVENLLLLNEEPQTQQGGPLQDFDIGEEIQVTATMLGPLRHGSSATFTLDVQSCAGVMVCGDLTSLRRILINLLSNAFKFTDVGTVSLHASAEIDDEKKSVLCKIRVVDTGKGIPEPMQTRIFDAFVTSGTHGAHVGTGLGLAISRQLAINLGGTLTLMNSAVAAGSEFALQLPFSVSSRCQQDVAVVVEDDVPDLVPAKRLSVLLAEDDPMTAQAVQLIVRQLQHEVTHVATYADLCKALRHAGSSYDIALIDHRLPGGQGLDAIRECRIAGLPLPKKVVLVTADVTSTLLLEAKNNCDDVVTKPTTAFVIRKLLRSATSTREERDQTSPDTSIKLSAGVSIIDEAPLVMLKRCGAERRALVHMCGTFNVTVNDTLTEIKPMLVTFDTGHRDIDILRKIVHRVCGSCLTMGAISLAAEFQKLAACDSSRMAERQYSVMVDTFLATKIALRVLLANMEKNT